MCLREFRGSIVCLHESPTAISPKSEHFTSHNIKEWSLISHTDLFLCYVSHSQKCSSILCIDCEPFIRRAFNNGMLETLMHIFYRRCVICILSVWRIKMQNAYIHCKLLRFSYLLHSMSHINNGDAAFFPEGARYESEQFHFQRNLSPSLSSNEAESATISCIVCRKKMAQPRETFQFYVWHRQKLNENFKLLITQEVSIRQFSLHSIWMCVCVRVFEFEELRNCISVPRCYRFLFTDSNFRCF